LEEKKRRRILRGGLKMAVFITGGYGHIASWSACLLAKQGERVIIYDTNTEAPDYLNEVSRNFEFVRGDVLDFAGLTSAVKKYGNEIEGIIHTVGIMGELVQLNPHYNVKLNIMGLLNVLEVARIFGIKKVLYTSSGAVYGVVSGSASEANPIQPSDLYASTKASAEYLGRQYENTFGIDFRVGRLYFVYGPGKYPSRFIRLYKVAFGALEGLQGLKADKGADQKLDFTYVEDAAQGVVLLFKADKLKHRVFNIATGKPHTVGEVAALAKKYTHFPVEVEIGPGELMKRSETLDITLAAKELGYMPKYDLEEGMKRYADWLGNQMKIRK
jgi:nucleoside-diphosphate-sugar epimerase